MLSFVIWSASLYNYARIGLSVRCCHGLRIGGDLVSKREFRRKSLVLDNLINPLLQPLEGFGFQRVAGFPKSPKIVVTGPAQYPRDLDGTDSVKPVSSSHKSPPETSTKHFGYSHKFEFVTFLNLAFRTTTMVSTTHSFLPSVLSATALITLLLLPAHVQSTSDDAARKFGLQYCGGLAGVE